MAEKKRGPGRPPKDRALTKTIQVKVLPDEDAAIRAAAARAGLTASTWSRPILLAHARGGDAPSPFVAPSPKRGKKAGR